MYRLVSSGVDCLRTLFGMAEVEVAGPMIPGQNQFRPPACTVCFDSPLKVPIYQCSNGHLLCFDCESRLNNCPTCNVVLRKSTKNRCLAAEEVQSQLHYCV